MVIKEIYIDGFGIFYEYSLKNLTKGVNIIEGENEAGKSTLLSFIRYTLFGYPTRGERHEPINNAASHGGRIVAELANGTEAIFERQAGAKGGKTQLHYNGSVSTNPSDWSILLGNANLQLFQSVYGFTLNELIGFDKLAESGIEDKIFSLGIGVTNVSIGDVENILISKAENIYKKGGSKQHIPKLLKSIEEKKSQIVMIQNGLREYENVVSQISNIQTQIEALKQKVRDEGVQKELLSNYLKCYDSYISILQIERDLKELPTEFVCPEDANKQIDNLDIQAETLRKSISQAQSNDSNDGIEQLRNRIGVIQINERLISNAGLITRLNEQFEKYQLTIGENAKTQKEIGDLDYEINENIRKISGEWSEEDITTFSNLVAHKDAIQQFGRQMEELKQNRVAIIGKQQIKKEHATGNKNTTYYLGISISLLLSIPAFFYSVPFGITFIGIALLVLVVFITTKKINKEGSDNELEITDLKISQLTIEYNNYLKNQLRFQPDLSSAAVLELFNLIDVTKRLLLKKEEQRNIYNERKEFIGQFEDLISELQQQKLFKPSATSYGVFVSDAKRELNIAKQNFEAKERLNEILEARYREETRLEQQLEYIQTKVNEFFQNVHAKDRNDFFQKFNSESKARQLLNEKRIHINTIEKIIGFGKCDELLSFLGKKERPNLELELEQLQETIDSQNSSMLQLTNEKGQLETDMRNLVSNSTLSQLETELEVERTKLFECYKEWLKSKMAFKVLSLIKKKYELERQPEVIRLSSDIFSGITSRRYKRIHVPIDSKEVLIYDQQERSKRVEQLSRGTKEQLLISLRLGLIQEYEKNKEPLPIVLDDVFVNFDSCRAKNIAEAIQKFAQDRQVIIFTCHPNLAQNFSGPIIKLNLVPFDVSTNQIDNELLSQEIQVN